MIDRWHRKVAAFVANLVTKVGTLVLASVPLRLDAIQVEKAFVWLLIESHIVENEEFRFRAKERRVGDPCALQIRDGFSSHVARITAVILSRNRILNIANEVHRGQRRERILPGRIRLRHDQHVRLVNRLPATNTGTIEAQPVFERVLRQVRSRDRGVLPLPDKIHKSQIDRFHIVLAAHCQYRFGSHLIFPVCKKFKAKRTRHMGSPVSVPDGSNCGTKSLPNEKNLPSFLKSRKNAYGIRSPGTGSHDRLFEKPI